MNDIKLIENVKSIAHGFSWIYEQMFSTNLIYIMAQTQLVTQTIALNALK